MLAFSLAAPMRILVDYDFDWFALGFHQGSPIGNSAVARRAEVKDVLRRARMKLESPQVLEPKLFFLCFLVLSTTVMRVRQSQGT